MEIYEAARPKASIGNNLAGLETSKERKFVGILFLRFKRNPSRDMMRNVLESNLRELEMYMILD